MKIFCKLQFCGFVLLLVVLYNLLHLHLTAILLITELKLGQITSCNLFNFSLIAAKKRSLKNRRRLGFKDLRLHYCGELVSRQRKSLHKVNVDTNVSFICSLSYWSASCVYRQGTCHIRLS